MTVRMMASPGWEAYSKCVFRNDSKSAFRNRQAPPHFVPRPRKASDDDVFAAAYRVMQRVGPADFTLDAIAREAGVTAAALVQRFGSKKKLQVRLAEGAANWAPAFIEQLRAQHKSPLAA